MDEVILPEYYFIFAEKNEQYNCLKMYALFSKVVILNVDLMATQIWSKYSSLKGVLFFNTRINH